MALKGPRVRIPPGPPNYPLGWLILNYIELEFVKYRHRTPSIKRSTRSTLNINNQLLTFRNNLSEWQFLRLLP